MDRFSRLCLWGSMACAFLSLALLSFDVFPWFRDPVLPHRPTYPLGIAGMALFILSGQWRGRMKEHCLLLGGISGLAVLAALATAWGLQSVPGDVAPDVWTGFLLWTLIPLAFWLWWAVMFSCLPCGQGKRLFHAAVLLLAVSNLAHILLEIPANHGATGIKDFLISINSWFRFECIDHGWWPPVYFTDRIRGLFAEPPHMAVGLIPVLGVVLALSGTKRLWLLGVACWGIIMWQGKIASGLLAFAVTCFAAVLPFYAAVLRRHRMPVLLLTAVLLAGGGWALQAGWPGIQARFLPAVQEAESLVSFVKDSHAGKTATCPELQGGLEVSSLAIRYTCARLDMEAGLSRPLGMGCMMQGWYWQPLEQCNLERGSELTGFVEGARNSKLHKYPPMNQYTTLLAETGLPGLALFLGLCGMLLLRSVRFAVRHHDWYVYAMACVFLGALAALSAITLKNATALTFFAGYLYAVSGERAGAADAPGGAQASQQERG